MSKRPVIAEPGYYELKVRLAKEEDKGQNFNGAGGVFEEKTNLFPDLKSFEEYLLDFAFDDSVVYHKDLEEDYLIMYDLTEDDIEYNKDYFYRK
jgi:hypothetical protein